MFAQGLMKNIFTAAQLEDLARAVEAEVAGDNPGVVQGAYTSAQWLAAASLVLSMAGVAYGFMTRNRDAPIASAAGAVGAAMSLAGAGGTIAAGPLAGVGVAAASAALIAVCVIVCGMIGSLNDAAKTAFALEQ